MEGKVIVTSMKRFYKSFQISYRDEYWGNFEYQGKVFVGLSFKGDKGIIVNNNKNQFKWNGGSYDLESTSTSLVCGTETSISSEWMLVGGPIKGSYGLKNGKDDFYDYIGDFGLYVQDPCQVFDDKLKINLDPTNKIVKDLKFHDGIDSQFWLPNTC